MSSPHVRIAQRAAGVRAVARRRRLIAVGVGVLGVALVWVIAFSPLIAVRHLKVEGAGSSWLRDQAAKAARPALGRPLVRADGATVLARVEDLHQVSHASVSRSLPSTLVVRVTPRVPVLAVTAPGGHRYVVDPTGYAYAEGPAPRDVPTVRVDRPVTVGKAQPGLRTLASVMAALSVAQRAQVSQVSVAATGDVTFHLGAAVVRWGGEDQTPLKARTLAALASTVRQQRPAVVDLSVPGRPVLS